MAAETRLYDLLEVASDASPAEIKKAFRRLALKHHPDRGGDTKTFQELSMAHEILSDSEKRQIYDSYGEEGLRQASQGAEPGSPRYAQARSADIGEMFGGFFQEFSGLFGASSTNRRRQPRKPDNVSFDLTVSLEELYLGTLKRVTINRTAACKPCSGTGSSKPGAEVICQDCQGSGVQEVLKQVGLGMVQRLRSICPTCGGHGRVLPFEYVCKSCRGSKTAKETKTLEISIPAGSIDGQRFVMSGEGDALPGQIAGDVIFRLRTAEHPTFLRNGHDLIKHERITLIDALCGCKLRFNHLDGRVLHLKSKPGLVVKPGSLHKVVDEGMPILSRLGLDGHGILFVQFDVVFPDKVALDFPRALSEGMNREGQSNRETGLRWWLASFIKAFKGWMAIKDNESPSKIDGRSDDASDITERIMEPVDSNFNRSRL